MTVTILHLAVDYNTPERPRTTTAIEWFVDALDAFENIVVAYKRTSRIPPSPATHIIDGRKVYHFPFFGLPLGFGLHRAMRRAAERTIKRLEHDGLRPDLVHAHKLTFEGIAGWYIARHFGVPLFVSLRGEVETKVFRRKRGLRSFLRQISRDAAKLYFVSAWFRDEFHAYVHSQSTKENLLPNIVRNVSPEIVPQPAGRAFVSVFNLDTWKRKGLCELLDAVVIAGRQEHGFRLEIIGGGSAKNVARITAMIAARALQDKVILLGPLPNANLLERLPTYRGLLLPSLNETFGMVYVEALFAGIPVLMTADTAIDGYLDGLDVALTVPPRDAAAIAAAILELSSQNLEMRANIAAAAPQIFARFDAGAMIRNYQTDVIEAVNADTSHV